MTPHGGDAITDATFLCPHCLRGDCATRPEGCADLFTIEHFGLVACAHDH